MMTPLGYRNRSVEKGVEEGNRWKNLELFNLLLYLFKYFHLRVCERKKERKEVKESNRLVSVRGS